MYVLVDAKGVILAISERCEKVSYGWKTGDRMAVNCKDAIPHEVDEIPEGVVPHEYQYIDGVFSKSPFYVEKVDEKLEMHKKINQLNENVQDLNSIVVTKTPDQMTLEEYRSYLKALNNQRLAEFLHDNPIQWTNGKHYGATEEDQTLMLNNYNAWKMYSSSGVPVKLEWNANNERCTEWEEEEYLALLGAIYTYAKKMLKLCQWYKVQIANAPTRADIEAIDLVYTLEKADELIQSLNPSN